jgi:hypothetical protein
VQRNIQLLERARGFYEVGTRPKIDVTRAQVDLANAELALVRARNAVAVNFAALNNAIGVPEHPFYRVPDELEIPPQAVNPEELLATLEESTRIALENRTELRALNARIRSAEPSPLSKRNFLPSSADANWSYRPDSGHQGRRGTSTVPGQPPLFSQVDQWPPISPVLFQEEITAQNIVLEVQQSFLVDQYRHATHPAETAEQAREKPRLGAGSIYRGWTTHRCHRRRVFINPGRK